MTTECPSQFCLIFWNYRCPVGLHAERGRGVTADSESQGIKWSRPGGSPAESPPLLLLETPACFYQSSLRNKKSQTVFWKSIPEKRLGCFCFHCCLGSHMCLTGGVIFYRLNQWHNSGLSSSPFRKYRPVRIRLSGLVLFGTCQHSSWAVKNATSVNLLWDF